MYKVSFLGESFIVLAGKKALDFFKQNERKYFQVKGSSPESWEYVSMGFTPFPFLHNSKNVTKLTNCSELYGTSNPILTAPESVHKLFRRACTTAMMSMKSVEAFYPTLRKILAEFIDAWADRPSVHSHQRTVICRLKLTITVAQIAFTISWIWVFGDKWKSLA